MPPHLNHSLLYITFSYRIQRQHVENAVCVNISFWIFFYILYKFTHICTRHVLATTILIQKVFFFYR